MSTMTVSPRYSAKTVMRWLEGAFAIIATFIAWYTLADIQGDGSRLYNIAGTFASVSGTLLGFVITALTILTAVANRPLMTNMRKTGHYEKLLKELFWTAGCYLVALLGALSCLFLNLPALGYVVAISVGVFVFASLLLTSSGRKLYRVMSLID